MKNIIFLIGFLIMGLSLNAQKFGYINSQELIQAIPEVKEANANIETYRNQLLKKGEEMIKSLQTKYQGLQAKQASGEIAPKQLEVEAQTLKQEELKIAEFDQKSQQQIFEKSESLLAPIREKVQKAIDDVAAENGFEYIFDYSVGFLIYADESLNVSDKVKAKLGVN